MPNPQRPAHAIRDARWLLVGVGAFVSVQLALDLITLAGSIEAGIWTSPVRAVLSVIFLGLTAFLIVRLGRAEALAARELALIEGNMQALLTTIEDWIWAVDRDMRLISSSDSVVELLGYEPEELLDRSIVQTLFAPEDLPEIHLKLAGYAAQRKGWTGWLQTVLHKDQSERHLESFAVPILDADGELIGWQGTSRDRTEHVEGVNELTRVTNRIRSVIDKELLNIVFQPIVDLETGRIVGAEALARFTAEPYRTPDIWFAAATEVGLGVDLELLAVRRALALAEGLPGQTYISINISPAVVTHMALEGFLALVDPSKLVLELTEHTAISQAGYGALNRAIRRLSAAGVRFAVDDAGAGFSSLHHVLELRPHILKLDQTMTRNIERDPARKALTVSLTAFAAEIGAEVIAEGIENEDNMKTLRAAGVRFGQGFGLGIPAALPLQEHSLLHPLLDDAGVVHL